MSQQTAAPAPTGGAVADADDGVVAVRNLTKTFGPVRAVDDLSFTVRPGRVTGFLGPNGAGKTTTLRMLLGLVSPTSGTATVSGQAYHQLDQPLQVVGAALEAASFHPGRSARDHLRVYAPQAGVSDARCDEVLDLVGLASVRDRRVGGFSLGMRQRLGLATTLLGDPQVLVLDEPANGLDPEGIAWLRALLRHLAGEGRTVLVSSHVLSEVQQTVDDVVIIARGRLVHSSSLAELEELERTRVLVTSPDVGGLQRLLAAHGWSAGVEPVTPLSALVDGTAGGHSALVDGTSTAQVGAAAFAAGLELHELANRSLGLEEIFLRLVAEDPVETVSQAALTEPGGAR